jgi:hypothetical protein
MDWSIVLGVVVSGVILIACWAVVSFWKDRPRTDTWEFLQYAAYAVKAARELTGATTNEELGMRAEQLLRAKFPKAPDVDIEVAIGKALDELEGKKVPASPSVVDPGIDMILGD